MAMNPTVLAADIKSAIIAELTGQFTVTEATFLNKFAEAVGKAVAEKVISHIQSFAVATGPNPEGGNVISTIA